MSDSESEEGITVVGTEHVDAVLETLTAFHYISNLKYENTSLLKNIKINTETPLSLKFINVTEKTKDSLSAFLQLCSRFYRSLSFFNKQRTRWIVLEWLSRSGTLDDFDVTFSDTEFSDIEKLKSHFKICQTDEFEKKYLYVISEVFSVNIILIEPFSESIMNYINTGDHDTICMLNIKDEVFFPVIVNGKYYHKSNEDLFSILRQKVEAKKKLLKNIKITLLETEDIPKNLSEIYTQSDETARDQIYADSFYNMKFN